MILNANRQQNRHQNSVENSFNAFKTPNNKSFFASELGCMYTKKNYFDQTLKTNSKIYKVPFFKYSNKNLVSQTYLTSDKTVENINPLLLNFEN